MIEALRVTTTDRPVGSILLDIVGNIQSIVRSEVRLARTELREELSGAGSAVARTTVGALLGAYAGIFALVAVVSALALYMPMWLAALVVSLTLGIAGLTTVRSGLRLFGRVNLVPDQAVQSVKEQMAWPKAVKR